MSIAEESQPETDGEVIQTIGYETVSELSTVNRIPVDNSTQGNIQNQEKTEDEEIKEIYSISKDKSTKDSSKKSKELVEKVSEDVALSSSNSSNNDICRICHMGNSISYQNCLTSGEHGTQDVNRIGNRTSVANLNLGLLVSACRCRGTVGLIHTKCLERWLTESGHTRCELCGYRYATVRVPRHGVLRSLLVWFKTFVATRQMLLDSLYLVVTTPLAVFSAYVCAMTLKMALENRIGEIPWTIVAMLPTCSLTLVAYWGWLLTLQRLHGRRWRQYWQSNFIVQLVADSPIVASQSNEELDNYRNDIYEDAVDIFNAI